MKTRLAGLILIASGLLFAYLFVYLPISTAAFDGTVARIRPGALVFIPLAIVSGLAFVIGGNPVLWAFQARPKSKGQLALVLSIIIGSGILTGIGYWQLKARWLRQPEPVILDASPKVPQVSERPPTPKFR